MALTEEQARTKWCPFARVEINGENGTVASANRLPGVGGASDPDLDWPSPRCIASDCMAWRDGGEEADAQAEAVREFQRTGRRTKVERVGFCGLAGRIA